MYIVAHPDDDLLFMNPDIQNSISQSNRVIVVVENGGYFPPGPPAQSETSQYWLDRERGNLNAYAFMATGAQTAFSAYQQDRNAIPAVFTRIADSPSTTSISVAGKSFAQFDAETAVDDTLSLIYLRIADGEVENMWNDPSYISVTRACPGDPESGCPGGSNTPAQNINRAQLIDVYVDLMRRFEVTSVSTLDSTNIYFDGLGGPGDFDDFTENPNHYYSALFATTAATIVQASTNRTISVRSYRGYTVNTEPQNLAYQDAEQIAKYDAFAYYAMFDAAALCDGVATNCSENIAGTPTDPTQEISPTNQLDAPQYDTPPDYLEHYDTAPYIKNFPYYGAGSYQSKKYATRTILGTGELTGRLRNGTGQCLANSGGSLVFQDCATTTTVWTITAENQIRLSSTNSCLTVSLSGGGGYITTPQLPAEAVSLASCTAHAGTESDPRTSSTMMLFGNGQIRTANGRCLALSNGTSVTSTDCGPDGGGASYRYSATASSSYPGYPASYAIDPSMGTRWSSNFSDAQNIQVDLGSQRELWKVTLNWETAYGKKYDIQVSDNGTSFTTVWSTDSLIGRIAHGGIDTIVLPAGTRGRYVRMWGRQRGTSSGYSLWDFRVEEHVKALTPAKQDWTLLFGKLQFVSSQFSNSTEVDDAPYYYKTLSIANQSMCVRRISGVYCSNWNGNSSTPGLGSPYLIASGYSDYQGWGAAQYGNTVRGIWDGDGGFVVACGRGYYGVTCTNGLSSPEFSNLNGWGSDYYYETVRFVDLYQAGEVSACGRGAAGIYCVENNGVQWQSSVLWTTQFSNSLGWTSISSAASIQYADISGDGRVDVCGRSYYGLQCSVMPGDDYGFYNHHYWSFDTDRSASVSTRRDFGNEDPVVNWSVSPYYNSLRLVDINRDGLSDACGRGPLGVYCALSTGTSFEMKRLVAPDITDAGGWGNANTGGTLSFGDFDGDARVDACVRGLSGVYCAEGW